MKYLRLNKFPEKVFLREHEDFLMALFRSRYVSKVGQGYASFFGTLRRCRASVAREIPSSLAVFR